MKTDEHLNELISGIHEEYKILLDGSSQGIYIYLDDDHILVNEKFVKMLGYDSAKEMEEVKGNFLENFVMEDSQSTLVESYQDAMEHFTGFKFNISWKKKDGEEFESDVILVPIRFKKHNFALHFID